MQSSSAHRQPTHPTSKHEWTMAVAGVILCLLGVAAAVFEMGGTALPRFATGAAGVAFVLFARSEALAWHKPLSLGHQLAMWWFWPVVFPVFLIATRGRRSFSMTFAVIAPLVGLFVLGLAYLIQE